MQSFLRDRNDWGTAVSDAHVSYSLLYEREIVQLHHASAAAAAAVGNCDGKPVPYSGARKHSQYFLHCRRRSYKYSNIQTQSSDY